MGSDYNILGKVLNHWEYMRWIGAMQEPDGTTEATKGANRTQPKA